MNEFHLILSNPHYVCRLRGPPSTGVRLERARKFTIPISTPLDSILHHFESSLVYSPASSSVKVLVERAKAKKHSAVRVDLHARIEPVSSPPASATLSINSTGPFTIPSMTPLTPPPKTAVYIYTMTVSVDPESPHALVLPSLLTADFPALSSVVAQAVLTTPHPLCLRSLCREKDVQTMLSVHLLGGREEKKVEPEVGEYPWVLSEQGALLRYKTKADSRYSYLQSAWMGDLPSISNTLIFNTLSTSSIAYNSFCSRKEESPSKHFLKIIYRNLLPEWETALKSIYSSLAVIQLMKSSEATSASNTDRPTEKRKVIKERSSILDLYFKYRAFIALSVALAPSIKAVKDYIELQILSKIAAEYLIKTLRDQLEALETVLKCMDFGCALNKLPSTPDTFIANMLSQKDSLPTKSQLLQALHKYSSAVGNFTNYHINPLSLLQNHLGLKTIPKMTEYRKSLPQCAVSALGDIDNTLHRIFTALFFANCCKFDYDFHKNVLRTSPSALNCSPHINIRNVLSPASNLIHIDEEFYIHINGRAVCFVERSTPEKACPLVEVKGGKLPLFVIHSHSVWRALDRSLRPGGLVRIFLSELQPGSEYRNYNCKEAQVHLLEVRKFPLLWKDEVERVKRQYGKSEKESTEGWVEWSSDSNTYLGRLTSSAVIDKPLSSIGIARNEDQLLMIGINRRYISYQTLNLNPPSKYSTTNLETIFTTLDPQALFQSTISSVPPSDLAASSSTPIPLSSILTIDSMAFNNTKVLLVLAQGSTFQNSFREAEVLAFDLNTLGPTVSTSPIAMMKKKQDFSRCFSLRGRLFTLLVRRVHACCTLISVADRVSPMQLVEVGQRKYGTVRKIDEHVVWDDHFQKLLVWTVRDIPGKSGLRFNLKVYRIAI